MTNTQELTDWMVPRSSRRGYGFPSHIMLNADMVLAYCSNTDNDYGVLHQTCGPYNAGSFVGCEDPTTNAQPSTSALVQEYANNNDAFLAAFAESYKKLTSVGYGEAYYNKLGPELVDLDVLTC